MSSKDTQLVFQVFFDRPHPTRNGNAVYLGLVSYPVSAKVSTIRFQTKITAPDCVRALAELDRRFNRAYYRI